MNRFFFKYTNNATQATSEIPKLSLTYSEINNQIWKELLLWRRRGLRAMELLRAENIFNDTDAVHIPAGKYFSPGRLEDFPLKRPQDVP